MKILIHFSWTVIQPFWNLTTIAFNNDIISFTFSGHGDGDYNGASNLCCLDSWTAYPNGDLWDYELASILENAEAKGIFILTDACLSGGIGPELMAMPNAASVFCTTTCDFDGYGYDMTTYQNGAWNYWFQEAGLVEHFGSSPSTTMEECFDWAFAQYNPNQDRDDPQKFDGNPFVDFLLV